MLEHITPHKASGGDTISVKKYSLLPKDLKKVVLENINIQYVPYVLWSHSIKIEYIEKDCTLSKLFKPAFNIVPFKILKK